MSDRNFFIPGGIEYFMPGDAEAFDELRDKVKKIFNKNKYIHVIPPIVDNLPNLLGLNSSDLDNQTITFIDKESGKKIGLRSDITPQIAKIDYQFSKASISRFSYMGDIYRSTNSSFDRKNPYQIGAEIFGCSNKSHDIEIISLMVETVMLSRKKSLVVEIGDVSIVNKHISFLSLDNKDKSKLVTMINSKNINELRKFLTHLKVSKSKIEFLVELIRINGDYKCLKEIALILKKFKFDNGNILSDLKYIANKLLLKYKAIDIIIDMSNLYNLDYQTNLSFSVFVPNFRKAIATGGRYTAYTRDEQKRLASGFSLDLKDLFFLIKEDDVNV